MRASPEVSGTEVQKVRKKFLKKVFADPVSAVSVVSDEPKSGQKDRNRHRQSDKIRRLNLELTLTLFGVMNEIPRPAHEIQRETIGLKISGKAGV